MCFENTLSGTLIMVGTIGVIRSWLLVPQTLVIVEDLRVDQFAAAYGISGIVGGAICVTMGPFAGDYFILDHIFCNDKKEFFFTSAFSVLLLKT